MFKWVAGLCASIYVTLLIFGAPSEEEQLLASNSAVVIDAPAQVEVAKAEVVTREAPEPVTSVEVAAEPDPAKPVTLVEAVKTAALDAAADSLVIQAPELPQAAEEVINAVASLTTQEPAVSVVAQPAPEPAQTGIGEIWRVTGSTVNLRADASTQAAVLGQTRRGDSAEIVELLDNGWARVYILESGQEAYMSAQFLERGN